MPTVAELTGNPLQFFQDNIVLPSYSPNNRNQPEVYQMGIADGWCGAPGMRQNWTGRTRYIGRAKPIVTVMNFANAVAPLFGAYWCPYEGNDLRGAFLGTAANLAFTAKMDGCTFAVGSALADGSRFVCHINSGGDQGRQRDMADRGDSPVAGDVGRRLFEPGAYRRRANNIYTQATTFGIRSPNGWRFYSQVNEFNSQARTIRFLRVDTI